MNSTRDLERLVADYYATVPPSSAPAEMYAAVLGAVDRTSQRHRWTDDPSSVRGRVGIAAILVAAVLVVAIGAIWWRAMVWQGPATPPDAPQTWSPERLAQDWPMPVRVEPGGDPLVIEMDPAGGFPDPLGDLGPGRPAWLDIVNLTGGSGYTPAFGVEIAGALPIPIRHPAEQWIAYGIVLDVDEDGVADVRIGMDNLPDGHRAWRTDLMAGETLAKAGPPYGLVGRRAWHGELDDPTLYGPGRIALDTYYPGDMGSAPLRGVLRYTMQPGERPVRYYAWASMIEDGRVVATDYAPDAGWLTPGPQPDVGLIGPTWSVQSWTVGDRRMPMPYDGATPTYAFVQFTTDGRVVTDAAYGPGRVEGDVVVEGDAVRITGFERRSAPCGGVTAGIDVVIQDVLLAPGLVYEIRGATLDLSSTAGSLRLIAEDAPLPD